VAAAATVPRWAFYWAGNHAGLGPMRQIPLVNIAAFASPTMHTDEQRRATADAWDEAMSDAGFAQICGHGVPPELVAELRSSALAFFSADVDSKMAFNHGSYGSKGGGYTAQGVESVARTFEGKDAPPDLVENYVLRGRPEHWGTDLNLDPDALPAHAPEIASVAPSPSLQCTLAAMQAA
jgi:isopenicillin N synthase-like dioxygenase